MLHIVKFTNYVGLRITTSFVFPLDVFCFIATRYLVQNLLTVFGMCPNFETHESMCPGYTIFLNDLKRVVEVNFKGVVQIIYKNKLSRKSFPIPLDMKAK